LLPVAVTAAAVTGLSLAVTIPERKVVDCASAPSDSVRRSAKLVNSAAA
jgi:hypothetical protein